MMKDSERELVVAARNLLGLLRDAVRGPEEPGIDLACSSTPLAETLALRLDTLEAALETYADEYPDDEPPWDTHWPDNPYTEEVTGDGN